MKNSQYILEKYNGPSTRHKCPHCGHKNVFTKYINELTCEPLGDHVGKCDRSDNCDYHFTPKEFFAQNPNAKVSSKVSFDKKKASIPPPSEHPIELVARSMSTDRENNFFIFLSELFGFNIAESLKQKYFVGTSSKRWPGATIFWRISQHGSVRGGKVMLYDPKTGKRIKEPKDHISWVHAMARLEGFKLVQCFFGEHLLKQFPDMPVAIVESEKTAMISSIYEPGLIWLATGGKSGCPWKEREICKVLEGRTVILFPDKGCFKDWSKAAAIIVRTANCSISVSDFLEQKADMPVGADLADYFIRRDELSGLAITKDGYPVMWDVKMNDLGNATGDYLLNSSTSNSQSISN
jgi:hypothetical protein